MRIAVAAGSGIRAYVVADVLRRCAELRNRPARVIAQEAPDLTGLSVPPPAAGQGTADVTVEVAVVTGVPLPTDDVVTRLLLLDAPPDESVTVTERGLEAGRERLAAWRRAVADWAEQASAPLATSYRDRAFAALEPPADPAAVVALLDELMADDAVPQGSRFETVAYLDRMLALELVAEVGRRR